jgi:ketosteroid isomerase-like protein
LSRDWRVAILREALDRWNRGEREIRQDLLDPDCEVRTSIAGRLEAVPVYRGYEGVRQWFASIEAVWSEWTLELPDVGITPDGRVLALGTVHGTGRGSGVELDRHVGVVVAFRDRKMLRLDFFLDHDEARAAAGAP